MRTLLTLEQARAHLRSDTDADDNDLEMKIYAASDAVLNYLKSGADVFLDTAGQVPQDSAGDPLGVPYAVYAAACLMLGYLYRQRDSSEDFQMGYLPPAVMALLYPLRDPALR